MRRERTMPHGRVDWFVFATALVALATTHRALAVDLSGDYVTSTPISCRFTDVQAGTSLHVTGACALGDPFSLTGTVDPDTGAFSVSGEIPGLCADFACVGTGDGEEMHGTCTSTTPACKNVELAATKCGNGVIDPLESCEDGNAAAGDCCSARCRLDPAGTACVGDGSQCVEHVCMAGVCVPGALAPAGQACSSDYDSCTADVCDGTGACTHEPLPPTACRRAVACHSSCTEQLKACRRACPGKGPARRACRSACAATSSCTAPGARIRTLVYAISECTDPQGLSGGRAKLLVRRGNCDPTVIAEVAGTCSPFQRLAVAPDGSGVVFEVTSQWSGAPFRLPPEAEGIFFVRADGRGGTRRLGPASRVRRDIGDFMPISPDGRTAAFIDLAPDGAGQVKRQLFLLDLRSGERRQLTYQPDPDICCESFLDGRTILLHHNAFGAGGDRSLLIKTNGQGEQETPPPIEVPGAGSVVPLFTRSGSRLRPLYVYFPDRQAVNGGGAAELFLLDGRNLLQLTDFRRNDTNQPGAFIAGGRVLFAASANPFGQNPNESCQLFSIDPLGDPRSLRQITRLSVTGTCSAFTGINQWFVDPVTETVLFSSIADPVGANGANARQVFAMRPDGTGLRQLTNASGQTSDPDGPVRIDAGPIAYAAPAPG